LSVVHLAPGETQSGAEASASPGEWALIWRRFRRDWIALGALFMLSAVVAACFVVEPILEVVLGHDGSQPIPNAVEVNLNPVGPFSWASYIGQDGVPHRAFLLLGGDGPLGRDELLRLLAGGRVSLEIALIATAYSARARDRAGRSCGLLRRRHRRRCQPRDGVVDVVPAAALR